MRPIQSIINSGCDLTRDEYNRLVELSSGSQGILVRNALTGYQAARMLCKFEPNEFAKLQMLIDSPIGGADYQDLVSIEKKTTPQERSPFISSACEYINDNNAFLDSIKKYSVDSGEIPDYVRVAIGSEFVRALYKYSGYTDVADSIYGGVQWLTLASYSLLKFATQAKVFISWLTTGTYAIPRAIALPVASAGAGVYSLMYSLVPMAAFGVLYTSYEVTKSAMLTAFVPSYANLCDRVLRKLRSLRNCNAITDADTKLYYQIAQESLFSFYKMHGLPMEPNFGLTVLRAMTPDSFEKMISIADTEPGIDASTYLGLLVAAVMAFLGGYATSKIVNSDETKVSNTVNNDYRPQSVWMRDVDESLLRRYHD